MLALHIARYPVGDPMAARWELLGLPGLDKLWALASTLAWLALLNVAAWSSGALPMRWLPLPPVLADLRPLWRIALGLALLAWGVLGLAALHALEPGFLIALLALPALALAGARLGRWPRPPRLARSGAGVLGVAVLGLGMLQAFVDVFGPEPGWDALTYHLALPERYLFENGVVMTPFSHLSGYALQTQMLYLLALAVDRPELAVLIHFEYGALLLWTLWRLGRRVSPRAALLAPLLLLAEPLFQKELGWAYADLPLAFHASLAAAAFVAWLEDPRQRSALALAGVACGLCAATRYLGALVPASLCLVLWLTPPSRRLRESLGACLALGVLSLCIAAPWLLRNALLSGNPVVPFLQSLFHPPGHEFIEPLVLEQSTAWVRSIGMGRDPWALLALPWNLTMETTPGIYSESFGYQVSPLLVVGVLAALLLPGLRRDVPMRAVLALIGVQTLLWFYTIQEPRFLLPVFALAAWVGGVAFDRLAGQGRLGPALLALPAVAVLYAQLLRLPALPEQYAVALGARGAAVPEPAQRAAALLRREMGRDETLLLLFERRGFLFRGLRYIPYHGSSGSPVLLWIHRQPHWRALHCELERMGVTHLFIDREALRASPVFLPAYTPTDYIADLRRIETLLREGGEPRLRSGGAALVRLRPASCDGPR